MIWAATSVCHCEDREEHFVFQQLSIALQRYNAILLHESFTRVDDPDL